MSREAIGILSNGVQAVDRERSREKDRGGYCGEGGYRRPVCGFLAREVPCATSVKATGSGFRRRESNDVSVGKDVFYLGVNVKRELKFAVQ